MRSPVRGDVQGGQERGDRPVVAVSQGVRLAALHQVGMGDAASLSEEAAPLCLHAFDRARDCDESRPRAERVSWVLEEERARRLRVDRERAGILRLPGQHDLEIRCQPQPPGTIRMVPYREQVDARRLVRRHEHRQLGLDRPPPHAEGGGAVDAELGFMRGAGRRSRGGTSARTIRLCPDRTGKTPRRGPHA